MKLKEIAQKCNVPLKEVYQALAKLKIIYHNNEVNAKDAQRIINYLKAPKAIVKGVLKKGKKSIHHKRPNTSKTESLILTKTSEVTIPSPPTEQPTPSSQPKPQSLSTQPASSTSTSKTSNLMLEISSVTSSSPISASVSKDILKTAGADEYDEDPIKVIQEKRKRRRKNPLEKKRESIKKKIEQEKRKLNLGKSQEQTPTKQQTISPKTSKSSSQHQKKPIIPKKIEVVEGITIKELAMKMSLKVTTLLEALIKWGVTDVTLNTSLDKDTILLIADYFNTEVKFISPYDELKILKDEPDPPELLEPRIPVVTIMGHVDHGKTTLLDAIRNSRLAEQEEGKITQRIGAYMVDTPRGKITFIDTPGHAAFTAMRYRGAKVTDIVVLVVAADEGVKPQTIEAIDHAKAADVPIIVAINKIDVSGANPDRVKQQLAQYGLTPEEWGGDTLYSEISALKKIGIDDLLDNIITLAEILELKANPNKMASGYAIEVKQYKGLGITITAVIKNGTLRKGDYIVVGTKYGKVVKIYDDLGKDLDKALPGMAVAISRIEGHPNPGDPFHAVPSEKTAKEIASKLEELEMRKKTSSGRRTITDIQELIKAREKMEKRKLKVVVKADTTGTAEAIKDAISKIKNEDIEVEVLHIGTGSVTESDVMLVGMSDSLVIAFSVGIMPEARELATKDNIPIRQYKLIQDVVNDVVNIINGMLEPEEVEEYLGRAKVLEIFKISKVGKVAGCRVTDGVVKRNAKVRIIRDGKVVADDISIESLKHFKEDVNEVKKGYECGIKLANYEDFKKEDIFEFYNLIKVKKDVILQEGETTKLT